MPQETLIKLEFERSANSNQPVYEQIRDHFKRKINQHVIVEGQALPKISDLSKKWNVNYRTIKSAFELLEKDGMISWEPNKGGVVVPAKKNAGQVKTKCSMAFIRVQSDSFYVSLTEGIKTFCEEYDIDYHIINTDCSHQKTINAINHPGEGVNGVIVVPPELDNYKYAIKNAIQSGINVVLLDRVLDGLDVSSVMSDHFYGAYEATRKMIEIHNRPVYHISRIDSPSSIRDWVRGWSSAMREYNFFNIEPYLFKLSHSEADDLTSFEKACVHDYENALQFFNRYKEDVYCIFAGNDYMARALYHAAETKGLVVGKDVFIVSYGDMPFAARLSVPLASVNQNLVQVGYDGAKVLYETHNGCLPHTVSRLIPVNFVCRESMGVKPSENH